MWDEPSVVPPPGVPWWDRALVAVLVPVALAEGLLRDDVPWPALNIGMALVCVVGLLWRRSHPLAATVAAFAAQSVAGLAPDLAGLPYGVLYVTSCVLLYPYSLARWASGRAAIGGVAFVLACHVVREPFYDEGAASIVIGAGFLLLPAAVGAAVRFQRAARQRAAEQARTTERERLARELHDTVAHHVSGIVIQAQAGQAVAASDPTRAVAVLATVEEAATRALADMRAIVGLLREDGVAERAPAPGIGDLARLVDATPDGAAAGSTAEGPVVGLVVDGEVADVGPALGAAVYRLVQESITNARRHAHRAQRIDVAVARVGDAVRVQVVDDGRSGPGDGGDADGGGYGLAGMAERVELLGGTFHAGPRPDGGWGVVAELPVTSATAAGRRP